MKNSILLLLFLSTSIIFGACNSDDEDTLTIDDLIGTYTGTMKVSSSSYTYNVHYVTVTKISGSKVKITPGTEASEWDASLTRVLGAYTCLGCLLSDQIGFAKVGGQIELTYNYDDGNEKYVGIKQP